MKKWDTSAKMPWSKLTRKQKAFADEYLKTGNGTQAAIKTYKITSKNKVWTASSLANQNLKKVDVLAYIKENASIAASVIMDLVQNEETPAAVRLGASKDVLDRAGYKPIERTQDVNFNINVESMSTEELLSLIKQK